MCALDVHPKEGTLSLLGIPRAILQVSLWGMDNPRAGGCWLLRLSSGDHMPAIRRATTGPNLSPSCPLFCSSEASCLPGVTLFTFYCLGNPICPLRPRSELSSWIPSQPLTTPGEPPHCGVTLSSSPGGACGGLVCMGADTHLEMNGPGGRAHLEKPPGSRAHFPL